jgi:hypothetical protein
MTTDLTHNAPEVTYRLNTFMDALVALVVLLPAPGQFKVGSCRCWFFGCFFFRLLFFIYVFPFFFLFFLCCCPLIHLLLQLIALFFGVLARTAQWRRASVLLDSLVAVHGLQRMSATLCGHSSVAGNADQLELLLNNLVDQVHDLQLVGTATSSSTSLALSVASPPPASASKPTSPHRKHTTRRAEVMPIASVTDAVVALFLATLQQALCASCRSSTLAALVK